MFGLILLPFLIFASVFYVVRVTALYKMMDYAGLPNRWASFIPGSEFYIFYKLLDGSIETREGGVWSSKKTKRILLVMPYTMFVVSFVVFMVLEAFDATVVSVIYEFLINVYYLVVVGIIGRFLSSVYLKKTSATGTVLAVLSPTFLFSIYILINFDRFKSSVDEFNKLSDENANDVVFGGSDGIDGSDGFGGAKVSLTKSDVATVDNGTREELFTDVKVENDLESGIHLTKLPEEKIESDVEDAGVPEEVVSELVDAGATSEESENARKVAIAQELFDAEVAALEAEKDFEAYSSESLEADLKALEAEFELAKVEEDERLRLEAERVEEEARAEEEARTEFVDSLDLTDEEVEIDVEVDVTTEKSVYGNTEGKSFSSDTSLDLSELDKEK